MVTTMQAYDAKFDKAWRAACSVARCRVAQITPMLRQHYPGKRPAIVRLCIQMNHTDRAVGCVVFSEPPKQTAKMLGGSVWELARLWIDDAVPTNAETWLIAKSVKLVKLTENHPEWLVSYADPAHGHRGTIYRAANWIYDGMTDADRKSPRCDYVDARTGKRYGRRGNVPAGAEIIRVPRSRKHRFLYRVTR